MSFVLLFWAVSALLGGFIATFLAQQKGYPSEVWFIYGLLIPPLGVIGAAGLPDKKLRRLIQGIAEKNGVEVEVERLPAGNSISQSTQSISDEDLIAKRMKIR